MKTKLLLAALLFFCFQTHAQTNGWYQYHRPTQIINLDVDASGNLHLATNGGYMKYNTTTNMVEDYANLTSQSAPIGQCTSVKVNPVNNHITLGFPSGQGIAIYDGTNYTIYYSGNSNYDDFSNPQFHYTDSGLLYIFDTGDTKYQTFENGVFNPVQNITFRPQAIIENAAGNKVYFAGQTPGGLIDGLYMLDKTTDTFTKYTTSNSGIHSNGPACFFRDTNDLLYIGGHRGISTLDAMGNWTTYQEPLPINPSLFYSVYSIDKFSDGTFLVNNSQPNTSSQNGFSTVDFSTNTWTHFDSSVFCDSANDVQNLVIANDMVYTHFRKFGSITFNNRLWAFDTSNNTCEEQNINHLNVDDLNPYGPAGLAMRQSSTNANAIELLWTNNSALISMDVMPNATFSNGFPSTNTLLTSTKQLNNINPVTIEDEAVLLVGDDDGVWFVDASNASTHVPHGLDFRMTTFDIGFSLNNGTKSLGVIGGWNSSTFDFEVRTIEANGVAANAGKTSKTGFNNNSIRISGPTSFGIEYDGVVKTDCTEDENGNLKCTASGQTSLPERYLIDFTATPEDNTNNMLANPTIFDPVELDETFPPDPNHSDLDKDGKKDLWFQDELGKINYYKRDPDTKNITVQNYSVSLTNDSENDQIQLPRISKKPNPDSGFYATIDENEIAAVLNNQIQNDPNIDENTKFLYQAAFDLRDEASPGSKNNQMVLNFDIIPDATLENLPSDFYVLNSIIFVYSQTHYASVLSTTHGLLINTAIDYSSLALGVDEFASSNNLKLFPNPANDMVSFSDGNIKNITVFDINGRKVLSDWSNSISIKTLSNGIYIVKGITSEGISISKKLIKN
ncbi:T9SS type A sorting domain-containing protein [Algibacter sp. 2305UL17-15]|uniref:T9SS type A sorting domain-containing protein n=1 Tax=Algibacter sp. 2305UL17-15 TaxID=3231268 RepID=UPI0034589F51